MLKKKGGSFVFHLGKGKVAVLIYEALTAILVFRQSDFVPIISLDSISVVSFAEIVKSVCQFVT